MGHRSRIYGEIVFDPPLPHAEIEGHLPKEVKGG